MGLQEGFIYLLSLKCYLSPWESSCGKNALREAVFELSCLEKGEYRGTYEIARRNWPWDSTKDQKGRKFMIVRTTERAEKETPKHSEGRRKVLATSHHSLLGYMAKSLPKQQRACWLPLLALSSSQMNWSEGAEQVLIRVSWTALGYFVAARLPAL